MVPSGIAVGAPAPTITKAEIRSDPPNVTDQLRQYVAGFSEDVPDIFEKFDLDAQIARLDASNTERCPSTLDLLERWDLWRSS